MRTRSLKQGEQLGERMIQIRDLPRKETEMEKVRQNRQVLVREVLAAKEQKKKKRDQ